MRTSNPEELLLTHIRMLALPEPKREYKFLTSRRFRADFAWPGHMLLCEVEGGTYVRGRHNRPQGYENDCEKYSMAALAGYRVMRFTSKQVRNGTAASLLNIFFSGSAYAIPKN